MPATVLRALYIFTQIIILTTYEVITNYHPLVKYETETHKKYVNHLTQGHKTSKYESWHFEPRKFGSRTYPLDFVMHSSSRIECHSNHNPNHQVIR